MSRIRFDFKGLLFSLISPRNFEKRPWVTFFLGLIYGSFSILLVDWCFSEDIVLSKASGILVVAFCMMFCLPFTLIVIQNEGEKDVQFSVFGGVLNAHRNAISTLIYLVIGLVISFSFWNIILMEHNLLNFQLETYCQINNPNSIEDCIEKHTMKGVTGNVAGNTKSDSFYSILENNFYVLIFSLMLALIFQAGAIFVPIWNASVIAAAISTYARGNIIDLPLVVISYMSHGIVEMAAYLIAIIAGALLMFGWRKDGLTNRQYLIILSNSTILFFMALFFLVGSAGIQVYIINPIFR